jgi:hypothetical protein
LRFMPVITQTLLGWVHSLAFGPSDLDDAMGRSFLDPS